MSSDGVLRVGDKVTLNKAPRGDYEWINEVLCCVGVVTTVFRDGRSCHIRWVDVDIDIDHFETYSYSISWLKILGNVEG